jgi:tRNA threonylcarbamoyladenosine biosynthesis protein TsaB
MHYILNIETATTVCSVSISQDGHILGYKEIDNGFTHSENLHLFINDLLIDFNISIKQLSAIAISKGPGSYTGLRIGVSAAKGLAYALNIPLISVDTLKIMAYQVSQLRTEFDFFCPMIDARRMEVYTCVYDAQLNSQILTQALIIDSLSIKTFDSFSSICFFGDGMLKCKEVISLLQNAVCIDNIKPSSQYMCALSYEKFLKEAFEDIAYFEPFYLKDFLITSKKTSTN